MSSSSSSSALARFLPATAANRKILFVILITASLTAGSLLLGQDLKRRTRRRRLRDQLDGPRSAQEEKDALGLDGAQEEDEMIDFSGAPKPRSARATASSEATSAAVDSLGARSGKPKKPTSEVIIRESLARNYAFFGPESMSKIREAFVVIVGLGGVGSAAATMLVRSGVRKVRLIDFDQVSLSSLNRHSTATLAEVGTPKVFSCRDYYAAVAPWVEVDARVELFSAEDASRLICGAENEEDEGWEKPDWVVDAIDNIDSKVALLTFCHQQSIPIFASLGAGAKSDPSRIQVADISTTFEDPLARTVRRRLRLNGVMGGIPVVYSTEKPRADLGLLPLDEEEFQRGKVDELSAIGGFRVRILPVLGPLPAMFGNAAATYVLQAIAGFEMEPLPVKNRYKMAATIHRQLCAVEQRLTGSTKLPFSEDDILYFFEEVHRARSSAPPHAFPSRPCLLRWKKEKGLQWDNLVLFDREEGAKHEQLCLVGSEDPEKVWGPEVTALVAKRAEEERRVREYRF